MAIKRPNLDQIAEIAASLGMNMDDDEVAFFLENMQGTFDAYDALDEMPDEIPAVKYPRTPGYRPGPDENPHNAWYWKSEIKGAHDGKLAGKTVAIKDNVMVAGVPMMNGASTLEGFVPDVDATIVTRMLDEGATILGKATCEHFCLSGGSHTSDPAPVHNPHKQGYSAGGSSSGSGALLAAKQVDLTIGGDQGGSIRMPAAYCGVYGMKPTHGLVPYTGVMPIELTIDHTGPMSQNVSDNALFLEVIAGADGLDPRQYNPQTAPYTKALGKGVKGMKIAVVREGFGHENSEADVDAKVCAAAKKLEALGATVAEVSIPMHLQGTIIWTPIALEGLQWQMMLGNGYGMNYKGLYSPTLIDAHAGWRTKADELSDSLKISMLSGQWGIDAYRGRFYAKAQNIMRRLRAAYDTVLEEHDLLLMPTLPLKATKLPEPGDPRADVFARAFEMLANTAPFDVTGHPSMAIPCGMSDGLPVSMMLTGKHFDEMSIYQAAHAFEQSGDWMTM
ncbi:MAG: amidase [Marinibacterium sp.]|nr:amidase [Marinibacterium sp.]